MSHKYKLYVDGSERHAANSGEELDRFVNALLGGGASMVSLRIVIAPAGADDSGEQE